MACDSTQYYITMGCNYLSVTFVEVWTGRVQHDNAKGSIQRKLNLPLASCLLALEAAMKPCRVNIYTAVSVKFPANPFWQSCYRDHEDMQELSLNLLFQFRVQYLKHWWSRGTSKFLWSHFLQAVWKWGSVCNVDHGHQHWPPADKRKKASVFWV